MVNATKNTHTEPERTRKGEKPEEQNEAVTKEEILDMALKRSEHSLKWQEAGEKDRVSSRASRP